jgi:hypothetical protein
MATFSELFEKIVERYPRPETEEVETLPAYYCHECGDLAQVESPDDLCPKCVIEQTQGYKVRMLAGRCANGAERDHGTRNHAIRLSEYDAVCGAKPGRHSVGWVMPWPDRVVTCPRCVKKLARGK